MVEGLSGVSRLIEQVSLRRVLFGSHAPLFYFESALLKGKEAELPEPDQNMVLEGNARRLLSAL